MRQSLLLLLVLLLVNGCNLTAVPTATLSPTSTTSPPTATIEITGTAEPIATATNEVPLITIPPLEDETPIPQSATSASGEAIPFPTTFINRYVITAREGQMIYINYDVTFTSPGRGRVFILVLDPSGVEAGRTVVTDTRADTLEIEAAVSGDYIFYITPENLSGNYTSSYGTR